MSEHSPNLNLNLYSGADGEEKFRSFMEKLAGPGEDSNMMLLDAAIKAQVEKLKRAALLDGTGKLPESLLPEIGAEHIPFVSSSLFQSAVGDASNVSDALENIGKVSADAYAHIENRNNPHGVTAEKINAVPVSRTINGQPLSDDITLSPSDIGITGKSACCIVVGTTTAGHTLNDCDYLCDGTNDTEIIKQAIQDGYSSAGENSLKFIIFSFLPGRYRITSQIEIFCGGGLRGIEIQGIGKATFVRAYNEPTLLDCSYDSIQEDVLKAALIIHNINEVSIHNINFEVDSQVSNAERTIGLGICEVNDMTMVYNCQLVAGKGLVIINSAFHIDNCKLRYPFVKTLFLGNSPNEQHITNNDIVGNLTIYGCKNPNNGYYLNDANGNGIQISGNRGYASDIFLYYLSFSSIFGNYDLIGDNRGHLYLYGCFACSVTGNAVGGVTLNDAWRISIVGNSLNGGVSLYYSSQCSICGNTTHGKIITYGDDEIHDSGEYTRIYLWYADKCVICENVLVPQKGDVTPNHYLIELTKSNDNLFSNNLIWRMNYHITSGTNNVFINNKYN